MEFTLPADSVKEAMSQVEDVSDDEGVVSDMDDTLEGRLNCLVV